MFIKPSCKLHIAICKSLFKQSLRGLRRQAASGTAHAPCIASQQAACRGELSRHAAATKAAVRPVLALQPQAASASCARGHCLSSPQPSREPERYAPSSPPARKRSFVRCGRRIIIVPSFASPREVHRKVRCQRSSRRTGQRGLTAGLPPPRAGLPATLTPPWGSATSRRCALGSLLLPHPPRRGTRCAAGYARCILFSPPAHPNGRSRPVPAAARLPQRP